ncbi:MAG TPA: DUF5615 family PIN-like protein [Actinotalea sp.]|nr:DUF5615 family PIN-like protein [Actinotalea sp.]
MSFEWARCYRAKASDREIVAEAIRDARIVLTQDLDFSAIVALSGQSLPSVVSLRLTTARVELVNVRLEIVLPLIDADLRAGALVTVEDQTVRIRRLPVG